MTLRDALTGLLATRGARSVTVASSEGLVVESVGHDEGDVDVVAGLIARGVAGGRELASLFGEGDLVQMTIEYERGPVLLAPLPNDREHVVVVVMDDLNSLGRIRLAVRRMLGEIAEAMRA